MRRRTIRVIVLAALAATVFSLTGAAAMPGSENLLAALAGPNGPAQPVVRVGTVVASPAPTGSIVWVQMAPGEPPIDMPYLAPYVPVAGDKVTLLFLSSGYGSSMQGIVLGGQAGQSGNRVLNGDFMVVDPTQGPPAGWTAFNASGAAATVRGVLNSPHETPVCAISVSSAAASDNWVYSAAWPVKAGERYRMDLTGTVETMSPSATLELRAIWFKEETDRMPNQLSTTLADSVIMAAASDFGLGDGVNFPSVPAGARFMRAGFRVIHDAGAGGNYLITVHSVQAYKAG